MSSYEGLPSTRWSLRGTTEEGDEAWLIRSIAHKLYRCPGCHGEIDIGSELFSRSAQARRFFASRTGRGAAGSRARAAPRARASGQPSRLRAQDKTLKLRKVHRPCRARPRSLVLGKVLLPCAMPCFATTMNR